MKISVIIPTYKPQSYLWECLDSVVQQTFPKECFEVVLVLNGCTEPYKSEIEKYIAEKMQGMNVNFIHTEEGGVSNARNLALDVAVGEYITFLDDDDYISDCTLSELYEVANKGFVPICNTLAFWDETKVELKNYIIKSEFEKCSQKDNVSIVDARRFFAGPVRKLIHRDVIGNRRFDKRFKNGEDSLFMFLISDRIRLVSCTSHQSLYYRRLRHSSANMLQRGFWERLKNSISMIIEYTRIYFSNRKNYDLKLYCYNILGAVKTAVLG
jgi:glycosyltransferase involved in cell wall biosynthesis